jgi:hypothetical protein
VKARISLATSAFWVGEHRQATTADSLVAISMNSFLNRVKQSYGDMRNSKVTQKVKETKPAETLHQSQDNNLACSAGSRVDP